MRTIIDEHGGFVARALRNAGVPRSDLDDQMQRTFLIAANRIEDVHVGAERSFLFQVALHIAAHARRSLARRREVVPAEEAPEPIEEVATPEYLTHRKQMRQRLDSIFDDLPESLRAAFTLSTDEGMDMTEIASRLGIPRGTVASRLRRARARLRADVDVIELAWECGIEDTERAGEPKVLRRKDMSALEIALLWAGTCAPEMSAMHATTLAVLGLADPTTE